MGKHKWKRVLVEHDCDGVLLTPFPLDISLERETRRSGERELCLYSLTRRCRWWTKGSFLQTWREVPSRRAIGLVIKRMINDWGSLPHPEHTFEWAARVGVSDVFASRQVNLTDTSKRELTDSMTRLAQELLDRDEIRMRRQTFNAFLNGTSLYDLSTRQLEDLSVALDWHLTRRKPGA